MIEVIINRADQQRILSALNMVNQATFYHTKTVLPRSFAESYRIGVINNIINQRFHGVLYKPYDERYAKWKSGVKSSKGFWHLFGDFVKNFQVHSNYDGGYFSGVLSGIFDSGGKSWLHPPRSPLGKRKSIAMYGYVMEWGGEYGEGGTHRARPLLVPTLGRLIESQKVSSLINESLETIGGAWR